MKFLTRLIVTCCLLGLVGGAVFLATWDMPPPVARVEKVIPADRFKP